jgi:hypothetical protein
VPLSLGGMYDRDMDGPDREPLKRPRSNRRLVPWLIAAFILAVVVLRNRLSVRGMLVVFAFAALALSAPEWMPSPPMDSLVVPVVGTTALAIEKARRDVERSRSRGVVVARFGLLVRIGISLPVAVLIVLCCRVLIFFSESSLWDTHWWICGAFTRPEVDIWERFKVGLRIDLQVKTGLGLCLGWVALSVWDRGQ